MSSWVSNNFSTIYYFFIIILFWLYHMAYRILVPQPGIEPGPLGQWKLRVLTTGPSGNSQEIFTLIFSSVDAPPLSIFSPVTPSVNYRLYSEHSLFLPLFVSGSQTICAERLFLISNQLWTIILVKYKNVTIISNYCKCLLSLSVSQTSPVTICGLAVLHRSNLD